MIRRFCHFAKLPWSSMNIRQTSSVNCSPLSVVVNKKWGSFGNKKVTFNLSANTTHVYPGYDPDDPLRPQTHHRPTFTLAMRAEVKSCLNDLELAMELD